MHKDASQEDLALLAWQLELGADEAIGDSPINRFEVVADQAARSAPVPKAEAVARSEAPVASDPIGDARARAAQAADLQSLKGALENFEHCALKLSATKFVFSDGDPSARVMIVGEAPGRDEDLQGRPFVGRAGQLLDRMLAAIKFDRASQSSDTAVYITNVLPWRPPQNRDPTAEEMAMMAPFVRRHIELADPDLSVIMGNIACKSLLGKTGITRLRGNWHEAVDRPALPMFHPAYLLRNPAEKAKAWRDLLSLQAKLKGTQT